MPRIGVPIGLTATTARLCVSLIEKTGQKSRKSIEFRKKNWQKSTNSWAFIMAPKPIIILPRVNKKVGVRAMFKV